MSSTVNNVSSIRYHIIKVKEHLSNIFNNIFNENSIENFLAEPVFIQSLYLFMFILVFYSLYIILDFTSRYNLYFIILSVVYAIYKKENGIDMRCLGKSKF